MRTVVVMLLAGLLACSGDEGKETPDGDADTDTDPHTGDTGDTGTVAGPFPLAAPPLTCFAYVEVDLGSNGTPEAAGYDGYQDLHPDLLVLLDRDTNLDGVVDQRVDTRRDADGFVLRELRHLDDDGLVDQSDTYTNDADGRPTHAEFDTDGDGVPNRVWDRTYDPVTGAVTSSAEDEDGDGTVDITYTWTYDLTGATVEVTGDRDLDPTTNEFVATWAYADPLNYRVSYDDDGNGTVDSTEELSYLDADHLQAYRYDAPRGGQVEREYELTYDAGLLLIEAVDIQRNVPAPPLPPQDFQYEFNWTNDASGRRIQEDVAISTFVGPLVVPTTSQRTTWDFSVSACP